MVSITFAPTVLKPDILLDCFFARHDPTMVHSLGKRAEEMGQYKKLHFSIQPTNEGGSHAIPPLHGCAEQLDKLVITEVRLMDKPIYDWFWPPEERQHQ
eukprot:scaffold1999_cov36-Attheya_sp.AAC.8